MAGHEPPTQVKIFSVLPRECWKSAMLTRDLCKVPSAIALALKSSQSCLQDELALVREEQHCQGAAKQERHGKLSDPLDRDNCQSAAVDQRLTEKEHARQPEAQATGEQSFQSACLTVVLKQGVGALELSMDTPEPARPGGVSPLLHPVGCLAVTKVLKLRRLPS